MDFVSRSSEGVCIFICVGELKDFFIFFSYQRLVSDIRNYTQENCRKVRIKKIEKSYRSEKESNLNL